MSMGGKPNELYGQAKDGAADIVYIQSLDILLDFSQEQKFLNYQQFIRIKFKTAMAAKRNF